MPLNKKTLEGLRHNIRLHLNYLVKIIVGEDALTEKEREELKNFKPLTKKSIDLIRRSFLLGRLKSILKKKEYKDITLSKLDQAIKEADLSDLERMAIDEARRSAGNYIKNLTSDIEAGIFRRLSEAEGTIVTEATIQGIVRDATALALLENKTWEALAQDLAGSLKVDYSKRLELIAQTELQTAKNKGIAQAIANKVDIYAHSNGPDSYVSVVAQPSCCEDCDRLYNNKDGTPKIFKLSDLMANGSNATRNHKKVNKIHVNWVPVVPASHPRCRCVIVYIPPGYAWEGKRLVLKDKDKLQKAIGDSKLSATRKPAGPPQKGPKPPPQPGNIPGISAVSGTEKTNFDGPSAKTKTIPSGIEYDYWSESGAPPSGNGWESYEKRDGSQGYRRPKGAGGKNSGSPDDDSQKRNYVQEAITWGKQSHPDAVKLDHLSNGNIVDKTVLGTGATESYRVSIEGNGRACMKPPAWKDNRMWSMGVLPTEGNQSIPLDSGHKREAAAYNIHNMFGLSDFVPPTVTRADESGNPVSMQSWQEGFDGISTSLHEDGKFNDKVQAKYGTKDLNQLHHIPNETHLLIDICPEDKKEKLINKLNDGAVMGIVMNHNDQHLDNVVINDNFDVRFIDNSLTSANGMQGNKSSIHKDFHNSGRKLKVSDDMMTRFKNTSLGDMKRALGVHIEDWAIGQTFLRTRYVMYLQETEGHLDFEKFRTTIGAGYMNATGPRQGFWGKDGSKASAEFNRRKESGLLQNQLFESFAKKWIEDSKKLPKDHPDHIAANQLDEIGVFMGEGFNTDSNYRKSNKHREYEKSIKAGYPPKDLKSATGVSDEPASSLSHSNDIENKTNKLGPRKRSPRMNMKDNDADKTKKSMVPLFIRLDRHL